MKTRSCFFGLFFGLLLILIGVLAILKNIFGLNVPLAWNIIWPLILIYLGIVVLSKHHWHHHNVFEDGIIKNSKNGNEYNVIFGKGIIDLTDLKPENKKIKINTVFGNAILKINKSAPVKIKASSVFANVKFPNESSVPFGESTYSTNAFKENSPYLFIEINTVFGETEIKEL